MEHTLTNNGYWLFGADGSVYPFGDAGTFGSLAGKQLNKAIVHGRGMYL